MEIGKKIQALRNSKLWTQEQLAEFSDVSERTISRLENGEKISNSTLQKIIDALGITLKEVLEKRIVEKEETEEVQYSFRIHTAKRLTQFISNTHIYGYNYQDSLTEEQIEVAQNFLISVGDAVDIWDGLELDQRFTFEKFLNEGIHELEQLDLWIFGHKQIDQNNWTTTTIEVYSKDYPLIQKVPLDNVTG